MRPGVLASVLIAVTAVAAAIGAATADAGRDHQNGWDVVGGLGLTAIVAIIAGIGLLVIGRSAAPRIGLLLLALAWLLATDNLARAIGERLLLDRGDDRWWVRLVVAFHSADWPLYLGIVGVLAIVFPTGTPLTARWRRVLVAGASGALLTFVAILLSRHPNFEPFDDVRGPVGLPDLVIWPAFGVGWVLTIGMLPAAVAAFVVRFRRSRGVERLQLKWFLFAVSALPLIPLAGAANELSGDPVSRAADLVMFPFVMLGVPVAVAIALTNHRLYEIDWIVNRTLVYATITALLGVTWIGLALALGIVAGGRSAWAAAAATAVIALLFGPVRRRIQDRVDRRFARARYDAVRSVRAFEDAVRDGREHPADVAGVLRTAVGDPAASLLLRLPQDGTLVDPSGALAEAPAPGAVVSPVLRDGHEIGIFVHGPGVDVGPELHRSVLAAASLTIELARLQVELRRQLEAVERSRERIVRAGYEERRRLERDLHDGAQQRLVGLGIRLRRIQRSLPRAARVLEPALDEAVDEVGRAIADLRTIAAGVRPPSLDDGLAAALAELARSSPLAIEVDVPRERLPAPVEAAAYYVACEAVTNAVKHASPSLIRVAAVHVNGSIRLVVADDGSGGASSRPGSGLAGLADRVGAHGGTLRVDSPPGAGTRVEAVIPCGW